MRKWTSLDEYQRPFSGGRHRKTWLVTPFYDGYIYYISSLRDSHLVAERSIGGRRGVVVITRDYTRDQ